MCKVLFRRLLIIFLFIISSNTLCQPDLTDENLCFKNQNYFMKPDYVARSDYLSDDHTDVHVNCSDRAQEEVYQAAFNLASECLAKVIADFGCGSGSKLLKYFSKFETIGFEIEPNFEFLKSHYPERTWDYGNFSSASD